MVGATSRSRAPIVKVDTCRSTNVCLSIEVHNFVNDIINDDKIPTPIFCPKVKLYFSSTNINDDILKTSKKNSLVERDKNVNNQHYSFLFSIFMPFFGGGEKAM